MTRYSDVTAGFGPDVDSETFKFRHPVSDVDRNVRSAARSALPQ